jgi:undecaprenyl diphosphate synthase
MHIAIIMDGNGRWALRRGLPRSAGHREGAKSVRRIVEAAARAEVDVLTLYAFSSDNWGRPSSEVTALMTLFQHYLRAEAQRCLEQSIRINVIGRRDRLTSGLVQTIAAAEQLTERCDRMTLRIAVDYSARHSILAAVRAGGQGWIDEDDVGTLLAQITGGEQRLSDFLLWECAYAELYFCQRLWPDFGETDFQLALTEFSRRERRFGKLLSVGAQA